MLTLLIPHKRSPENDRALEVAIRCAEDNYVGSDGFVCQVDDREQCPYKCWNEMVIEAKTELLIFSNSDVFFAEGWNLPYEKYAHEHLYLSGTLVEPGVIGVASVNVHKDFGRTPETFRREEFEQWCREASHPPFQEKRGWCMPCAMMKSDFLEMGGFNLSRGTFPTPLDLDFIDRWVARGWKMGTCNSYSFHLQSYNNTANKACRFDEKGNPR